MNQTTFLTLELSAELMQSLSLLSYDEMTPIQAASLPAILKGKDVIAQAKTGSGKTVAFGIGVLSRIDVKAHHVQALLLCPTRELADQVAKEIRKLARMMPNIRVLQVCGGVPFNAQAASLERSVHVVVGTPGRVEEHLQRKTLALNSLDLLVLDEADRMLDMGFQPSIDSIVARMNQQRQTLLFSATYPDKIHRIAQRVMTDPLQVEADTLHDDSSIQQFFYKVTRDEQRLMGLRLLLLQQRPESTLVFCNTKREADAIAEELQENGFSALALHGDIEQKYRREILVQFTNNSIGVLVATDVAARGLDINNIDAIVNYQIARDPEVHVHRIGRTGRAGSSGKAYSFYSEQDDDLIKRIEGYWGKPIKPATLPPVGLLKKTPPRSTMVTLKINGGKSQKVSPGDIVGALTRNNGVKGSDIGVIQVYDRRAYVAVSQHVVEIALHTLNNGKLKGRSYRVSRV